MKIIRSEVDLYLFLQRRFLGVDVNSVRITSCENRTKYAPHFELDFLCPLPWLFGWTFCVLWKFEWKIRIEFNIFFFWWNFSHFLWIFPCKIHFFGVKNSIFLRMKNRNYKVKWPKTFFFWIFFSFSLFFRFGVSKYYKNESFSSRNQNERRLFSDFFIFVWFTVWFW